MTRAPFEDDLSRLLANVPRDWTVGDLVGDEHRRYRFYLDVMDHYPLAQEELLRAIRNDPDRAMRDGALGKYVDSIASRQLSAENFSNWVRDNKPDLASSEFAMKRAEEWELFKRLDEGQLDAMPELFASSNWLQLMVANELKDHAVLDALQKLGRTRRIRTAAAEHNRREGIR